MSRKDKARTVYVTSSDTNIHAAAAGDRNGGIAKVPPTTRDVPPRPAASAAHATASQPVVSQRCGIIILSHRIFILMLSLHVIMYIFPCIRSGALWL